MTPIDLNLPSRVSVVGELLRDYSNCAGRLGQDILQVSLPNDIVIDVGWTARFDPKGSFLITIFRGEWGNDVQPPFTVESPFAVAFAVRDLVEKFLNPLPVMSVNESGSSSVEYHSRSGSNWTLA